MPAERSKTTLARPFIYFAFGVFNGVIFANFGVKYTGRFCLRQQLREWISYDQIPDGNSTAARNLVKVPLGPYVPDGKSDLLYNDVKVLCFVMTSNNELQKITVHVKETWWTRCNVRLFMGSEEDKNFPVVQLKDRKDPSKAIKEAFQYVWDRHRDGVDWFVKADHGTYVVLENLRNFLKDKNPKQPVYYGRKLKGEGEKATIDENAGYVLSKAALERFVKTSPGCETVGQQAFDISKCLNKAGVEIGDSRDSDSRELFHSRFITSYTSPSSFSHTDVLKKDFNPTCVGIKCTTNKPITFHGVDPIHMYVLDYAFYKSRVNARCAGGYRI